MAKYPNDMAVLFDFGGVLMQQDWDVYDAFGREHGLPKNGLRDALYGTEAWQNLQTGIGDREIWARAAIASLAEHCGERAEEVFALWHGRTPTFHDRNIALANGLRAAGHRIGLLSNAAADLREALQGRYKLGIKWDDEVISGLVNLAKPDEAIFRLAADRIGLPPEGCFFIDDAPRNVEGARATGMATYHFVGRDYDGLQQALSDAGYVWESGSLT